MFSQTYPAELVDVVVADGGSTDRTREIVDRIAAEHRRLRLIDNPKRIQAAGLNAAIQASDGEIVARLDGHAAWPADHLLRCVEVLERTHAANVGGTMDAVGDTSTGQAIALATRSPLAVGGARYRYARREQEVNTVWPGCYRRSSLEAVGGYDESLDIHEDYELNQRIRAAGGRIVYSPQLPVRYWTRASWRALARQFFRYGRGKARVAAHRRAVVRPYHAIPPLFVLYLVATPIARRTRNGRRLWLAGATLYAAACLGESVRAGRGASTPTRVRIAMVFPTVHIAWGLGFLAGAVEAVVRPRR